ncbi:LamG domain-containing protein [Hymenobacter sp. BT175]|uniref:LamG domain-containing protein n=1 Tax=Hymenobacter translucens TaxID=2886507 RepID=UPI001D0EF8A2|nr:LamG domain-containing protein [Hymenobacter translucens]MCC2546428.1 LamG domain-containing protein [Hymenobacter translucens]
MRPYFHYYVCPVLINRALQFNGINQFATLPIGNFSVMLGAEWKITIRFRPDAVDDGYIIQKVGSSGGATGDIFSVLYGFVGSNLVSFWNFQRNNTGNSILVTLNTPCPPGAFYTVLFHRIGDKLYGYLNGVLDVTYTSTFELLDDPNFGLDFAWSARNAGQGYEWQGTLDSVKIESDGATLLNLPLNEQSGPFYNSGTAGGQLLLTGNPTRLDL